MSNVDIKSTLQSNISNNALALASSAFPGPIQSAINYYLNGITIPLGSSGSLSVSGSGANLVLNMSPVVFKGSATADSATLEVAGTGEYSDAAVDVKFTNNNGQVAINLNATMGQNLAWHIADLWPTLFNYEPFSKLVFSKGTLALTTNGSIKFTGTGALSYNGTPLANGALALVYNKPAAVQMRRSASMRPGDPVAMAQTNTTDSSQLGVLVGVVVQSWSPGSIWSPLNDVVFKQSGLLFSSLPESDSKTLADMNLIDSSQVPSIVDGSFSISPGVTFFTTLELSKFLGPLALLLGNNQTLALYANQDLGKKLTILAKFSAGSFGPGALFEFNGFELSWIMSGSSYALSASATGLFYPPDGSAVDLVLKGTIQPNQGDIDLSLALQNWVHPFGYEKLIVRDFEIGLVLGAAAEGVTITISGDFEFTVQEKSGTNTFEFGVAGEITDFEVVTGIAFLLKAESPGQEISLGDMVQAITSINVSSIPVIDVIDEILQIGELAFAVVEGSSLTVGKRTFNKGFTLNADFDILQQENILLDVEVTGTGASQEFSGLASMEQAVQFSSILSLCAYNPDTRQPDCTRGPEFAVSSKGIVIDGVNNGQPVYFYASSYVKLLDIISSSLYGIATTDGLFRFVQSVQAGTPNGNNGAWAGNEIWIGLDPKNYAFDAGFDFNFGWKNVSIGPLTVFGVELIPTINLPDFAISAGLGVSVDGKALTFKLQGEFTFSFLGLNLSWGSPGNLQTFFSIDLGNAPATLAAIRDKVWSWLLSHLTDLLQDVLNVVDKFVSWVKDAAASVKMAAEKVAEVLADTFNQTAEAIGQVLKDIGYAASQIYDALVSVGKFAVDQIEKVVNDLYTKAKDCAVETAAKLGGSSASSMVC